MYILVSKIALAATVLVLVTACSNDFDLNNLDETFVIRHKDADMPVYVKGNANEKVFLITLHGDPGGIGLGFRGKAFNAIESEYGVVYFDQRGSGNAQGHYSESDVNIDLMAEDVLALVKVMKEKFGNDSRFFLLGQSWGGTLGPTTLLKDQGDFKGWISTGGAYSPARLYDQYLETYTITAHTQIALGNSVDFWESVLQLVSQVDPVNNIDDFFELNKKAFEAEECLQDDGFIDSPDNGTDTNQAFFAYNPLTQGWNQSQIGGFFDDQGLFQTLDLTNQLSGITIPSLIISGRYDMVVPIVTAQIAYENIGSEFKDILIYEKSGHSSAFSEHERFAEDVLQFMNTHK